MRFYFCQLVACQPSIHPPFFENITSKVLVICVFVFKVFVVILFVVVVFAVIVFVIVVFVVVVFVVEICRKMRKWWGKFVECCALTSIYPRGSSIVVLSHCVFTLGIFLKYTADIIKNFLCALGAIGFLLHSFVLFHAPQTPLLLIFVQIIQVLPPSSQLGLCTRASGLLVPHDWMFITPVTILLAPPHPTNITNLPTNSRE